jgi:hypothetical protein
MKLTTTKVVMTALICLSLIVGYFIIGIKTVTDSPLTQNTSDKLEKTTVDLANQVIEIQDKTAPVAQECQTAFKVGHDRAAWQRSKMAMIESWLIGLDEQGVDEAILDEVAISSGIGLFVGRIIRSNAINTAIKPPYYTQEASMATPQEYALLNSKLKTGDFDGLAKAIFDKKLRASAYYPSATDTHFLFGYILDNDISHAKKVVDKLLDSDFLVQYSDLATATALNMPLELLKNLYSSSGLDANKILRRFGQYRSLAIIALDLNHVDLANFWIDQGSPLQPDPFDSNALDILGYNGSQLSQAERDTLFEKIAKVDVIPNWRSTFKDLQNQITPSIFKQYADKMNRQNTVLAPLALNKAQSLVHEIHQQVLTNAVDFELDTKPEHECFTLLGVKLTQVVFQSTPSPEISEEQAPSDAIVVVQPTSFDSEIAQAKEMFKDERDVIAALGEEQGLANKQAIAQYQKQQMAERVKEMMAKFNSDPNKDKTLAAISKIYELARKGQWNEALPLFEQLKVPNSELLTTLLMIALDTQTEFGVIKALLERGAELLPNAIERLITTDDVEMAQKLLPYGLDIHGVVLGYSPLARCVKAKSLNMLKFLLRQGVVIDSHLYGFDALDIALQQFDLQKEGLVYVDTLIGAGATVELSHKQIVSQMSVNNMEAFLKLTSRYSELRL